MRQNLVFKSRKKLDMSNYQQISILCSFSKLLNQHGFMIQWSTITNLAVLNQFICKTLDAGGQVDVIYSDISKAVDRMDHLVLLCKLVPLD